MIYNNIDTDLISLGKAKKFTEEEEKWITPIYYEGESLDFTLKNKYVKINKIEENSYGKKFVTIKSKEYSKIIESISEKLGTVSPISSDGSFRAFINNKTKINEKNLDDVSFNACVSLVFPTIYKDTEKKTLQIYIKDLVVVEIIKDELEIELDKLSLAM
uniref:S.kluyveri linear plasmid pSKL DNA for open reading frames 1-10 n=1 Tax=Lachancea kluyveri TaxID=4934 RepID=Q04306_LACKL|nr:unnamed protein product [Lachancea kluyveri]prf//1712308E ORF 5 [Lachancea kluyveri]